MNIYYNSIILLHVLIDLGYKKIIDNKKLKITLNFIFNVLKQNKIL